jgi:ribosome biogenesis protein ERB1
VRIGRVPYHWYDEFKHFGYDNTLTKVEKQKQKDKIEEFIEKAENKDWWRTITDHLNNKDIVLTDKQLELIDRIRSGKFASKAIATNDDQYEY